MLLVFYIFAVMFTNLFRNAYADGYCTSDYWGSLDKTLLTMYQLMTLDSWSMITRETMEAYTWSWFPIIIYVTLTAYLVLNLIIAALVDSMMEATKDEQNAFAIENSIIMSNDMSGLRQSIDQLTSQQQLIVDALSLLKNPHFQKH
uniref:Ion transport domain-containing protein n=1 Tax=Corethron hystrix TaxID=216773 RepID=A0A7S1FX93_9STRA|mmetsp:Transcript_36401/g.85103  ORF Transcript_36401/g.85103 Transcript_36401/m.85103 type:complete len:146 (+) Transcript_36401:184-621(+)